LNAIDKTAVIVIIYKIEVITLIDRMLKVVVERVGGEKAYIEFYQGTFRNCSFEVVSK